MKCLNDIEHRDYSLRLADDGSRLAESKVRPARLGPANRGRLTAYEKNRLKATSEVLGKSTDRDELARQRQTGRIDFEERAIFASVS